MTLVVYLTPGVLAIISSTFLAASSVRCKEEL